MIRIRFFFSTLFIIFSVFQSQALSSELSDFDVAAIKSTVKSQLDAFAQDDFEKAYTYAAPSIKKIFLSPDNFKQMVINQYSAVYRNSPAPNVFLVDPDGNFVTAMYMMEKQENNDWLIAGCILSMSAYEQI